MTSLDIAQLTGKAHKHVNETIKKKVLPALEVGREFDPSLFLIETGTYKDSSNRLQNMYILNKHSANALVSYYDFSFACKVINHMHTLEQELETKQKELDLMKSIVWEVINGQAWISQEQALKMSGVKHPRLFMKYLKQHTTFLADVVNKREFLQPRQCNKQGDIWWKFSKEGFKWLLEKKEEINVWVDKCKCTAKGVTL